MGTMSWKISVTPPSGGGITADAVEEEVEATDRIEVTIDAGAVAKAVEVQPGGAADIQLLLIKSNLYSKDIQFFATDSGHDSPPIKLTSPQLFTAGGIALFGDAIPTTLKFTNSTSDPVDVMIFVARKAT